jgi:demethylmenaquinone methyltransferase/2-methoxy-6-polyprenyl-1,4-benzoquinol methylase
MNTPTSQEPSPQIPNPISNTPGVNVKGADGSGQMFDQIARRYDLLNRIISLRFDQGWRRKLVASLPNTGELLDVATGTADVALSLAHTYPSVTVMGLDPSVNMLEVGHEKVDRDQLPERVSLEVGTALDMHYQSNRFAGSCVAFGVRNFPDRLQGMREMNRVTQAGGPVAVLELSEPRDGLFAPFVRFHVHHVVPWLGAILSGNREYRYLQKSVQAFPSPQKFAELMEDAGIRDIRIQRMPFGVAHLYVGQASESEPKTEHKSEPKSESEHISEEASS